MLMWLPDGKLFQAEKIALAVPAPAPSRDLWFDCFRNWTERRIKADVPAARAALMMSVGSAPEMYAIAQMGLPTEWATMIAASDSLQIVIRGIDWSRPGTIRAMRTPSFRELVE